MIYILFQRIESEFIMIKIKIKKNAISQNWIKDTFYLESNFSMLVSIRVE